VKSLFICRFFPSISFLFLAFGIRDSGFSQSHENNVRIILADRYVGWTLGAEVTRQKGIHRAGLIVDYLTSSGIVSMTDKLYRDASKQRRLHEGLGLAFQYALMIHNFSKFNTRIYVAYDLHISKYRYEQILLIPFAQITNGTDTAWTYTQRMVKMPPSLALMNNFRLEFTWELFEKVSMFANFGSGIALFEENVILDSKPGKFTWQIICPVLDAGIGYLIK